MGLEQIGWEIAVIAAPQWLRIEANDSVSNR
jgi:hypothetical protein